LVESILQPIAFYINESNDNFLTKINERIVNLNMLNTSDLKTTLSNVNSSIAAHIAYLKNILVIKMPQLTIPAANTMSTLYSLIKSLPAYRRLPTLKEDVTFELTTRTAFTTGWMSLAYGNGMFVAIGYNSSIIMTSPTGVTWTQRTAPSSTVWRCVAYGNGRFVAASYGTTIGMVSLDGITWTATTLPTNIGWESLCFGNGIFVLIAHQSAIFATSVDGINWTQRSVPVSALWSSIAYGNGTFVAISRDGYVATSIDGITWAQPARLDSTLIWKALTYGNGMFVAGGGSKIATSPYGITWTETSIPAIDGMNEIAFAYGIYAAVTSTGKLLTSVDSINWTVATLNGSSWGSICYGHGRFLAAMLTFECTAIIKLTNLAATASSVATNKYFTSVTKSGASYNLASALGTGSNAWLSGMKLACVNIASSWGCGTYGNGLYILPITASTSYATSSDGYNWTTRTSPQILQGSIAYGNGVFIATVNTSPLLLTSTDGINWTTYTPIADVNWTNVQFLNNLFVLTCRHTTYIMRSTTGLSGSWIMATLPSSSDWLNVAYGNGLYIVIAHNNNVIATSPDAITWTQRNLPVSTTWTCVAYGNGIWVALSYTMNMATSPDGITWTARTARVNVAWNAFRFINGTFIAVAANSNVMMVSMDGINWTIHRTLINTGYPTLTDANGIGIMTYTGSKFIHLLFPQQTSGNRPCVTEGTAIISANSNKNVNIGFRPDKVYITSRGYNADFKRLYYSTIYDDEAYLNEVATINGNLIRSLDIRDTGNDLKNPVLESNITQKITDTGFILANKTSTELAFDYTAIGSRESYIPSVTIEPKEVGVYWSMHMLPVGGYFFCIGYGNGMFVTGLRGTDTIITSTDGVTWTSRTSPIYGDWRGTCYSNGTFVMVSYDSELVTSTDGITWTERTVPITINIKSVCNGNGTFVAVGNSNAYVITSIDGTTWTQRNMGIVNTLNSIIYGNGIFVAVGASCIVTSTDGITWTSRTSPSALTWSSVAYGNGIFVAIGEDSSSFASSTDGITWTLRNAPVSELWQSVCYGNGTFIAIAGKYTYTTTIAISNDGITWTQKAMPITQMWYSICYGNGMFAIASSSSDIIAISKLEGRDLFFKINGAIPTDIYVIHSISELPVLTIFDYFSELQQTAAIFTTLTPSIATVSSSGVVTFITTGTAYIRATAIGTSIDIPIEFS